MGLTPTLLFPSSAREHSFPPRSPVTPTPPNGRLYGYQLSFQVDSRVAGWRFQFSTVVPFPRLIFQEVSAFPEYPVIPLDRTRRPSSHYAPFPSTPLVSFLEAPRSLAISGFLHPQTSPFREMFLPLTPVFPGNSRRFCSHRRCPPLDTLHGAAPLPPTPLFPLTQKAGRTMTVPLSLPKWISHGSRSQPLSFPPPLALLSSPWTDDEFPGYIK